MAQWSRLCLPTQETQETWVQSLGHGDPLEKGMATHSSILAWRIPWTEEPGGLQSMGWLRVGHNWMTEHTLRVEPKLPKWMLNIFPFLGMSSRSIMVLGLSESLSILQRVRWRRERRMISCLWKKRKKLFYTSYQTLGIQKYCFSNFKQVFSIQTDKEVQDRKYFNKRDQNQSKTQEIWKNQLFYSLATFH